MEVDKFLQETMNARLHLLLLHYVTEITADSPPGDH